MAVYTGKKLKFTQNGDDYILDPVGVLEYADMEHFPATGESGKLYIALDSNAIYRWDVTESKYVPVSSSGGGGAAFTKINFSIATTDWTLSNGSYIYTITNDCLVSRSAEIVTFNSSIESLISTGIDSEKDAANHRYTFIVDSIPSGTVSGKILSFCDTGNGIQTVFEDAEFEIETTDWVGESAPYTVSVSNSRVNSGSGLFPFWGPSYDLSAKAAINITPGNGAFIFSTNIKPVGTISGFVRVIDSINGTIPPERGGTGGRTPAEACAALGAIPTSQKGVANGVATLDGNGLIPSNLLPSYVDDVLEYDSTATFPESGEIGKIYVAKDTNKSYRWSGSGYVELSSYALATAAAAGLMSATDKEKLDGIAAGAQVNPGNATTEAAGLMSAADKTKLEGIETGAQVNPEAATTEVAGLMSAADKIKLDGIAAGAQVNPGTATQSADGLMSSTDKKKLDGVATGANNYSLPLAANGTRGGIQLGYSQNNKNYPVQLSSEKAYVNVPWENTWRGIQNNLTSSSTSDSLSANQGRILKNRFIVDDVTVTINATAHSDISRSGYWPASIADLSQDGTFDLRIFKYGNQWAIRNPSSSNYSGTIRIVWMAN